MYFENKHVFKFWKVLVSFISSNSAVFIDVMLGLKHLYTDVKRLTLEALYISQEPFKGMCVLRSPNEDDLADMGSILVLISLATCC